MTLLVFWDSSTSTHKSPPRGNTETRAKAQSSPRHSFASRRLCAVKFQPVRTLIAYQRGLQSTMLDRDEMVGTFEAVCAAEPAFLFPYFSGFSCNAFSIT